MSGSGGTLVCVTDRPRTATGPSAAPEWVAYVDESMRLTSTNQGTYLLAAVVLDAARAEEVRTMLRSLLYRRQERLH